MHKIIRAVNINDKKLPQGWYDHIISSFNFEQDDLEMAPFDSQGGLGKMYQLFGNDMNTLIDELNEELVA